MDKLTEILDALEMSKSVVERFNANEQVYELAIQFEFEADRDKLYRLLLTALRDRVDGTPEAESGRTKPRYTVVDASNIAFSYYAWAVVDLAPRSTHDWTEPRTFDNEDDANTECNRLNAEDDLVW